MDIIFKPLEKKDYKKAIQFAITGMNFNRYMPNKFICNLYGKYFLYYELQRATQNIAAYVDDNLVGVVMLEIFDEKPKYQSFNQKCFVELINLIIGIFNIKQAMNYDTINKTMLNKLKQKTKLDGELCFLAADPTMKGKGIGSALLNQVFKENIGKTIYLYTDNNCSYNFYEYKGFTRIDETTTVLNLSENSVPSTFYLYAKKI